MLLFNNLDFLSYTVLMGTLFIIKISFRKPSEKKFLCKKLRATDYSMFSEGEIVQKNPKLTFYLKWVWNSFFLLFAPCPAALYETKHPIKNAAETNAADHDDSQWLIDFL